MEQQPVLRSTDAWEEHLGREVRRLRLRQDRSQQELALAANVSLSALKGLELGHGSRLRTLILVARALGRDGWLESFAPPEPAVSPMQRLRERQREDGRPRQRAPRRRPPT